MNYIMISKDIAEKLGETLTLEAAQKLADKKLTLLTLKPWFVPSKSVLFKVELGSILIPEPIEEDNDEH